MPRAIARYQTAHGATYLAQLSKHFAHKVEVAIGDGSATCRFAFGTVVFAAEPDALRLDLDCPDAADRPGAEAMLDDHLKRFAFREPPQPLIWIAQPPADAAD